VVKAREPARIMLAIGNQRETAGIFRSDNAGSPNTTSMSTTAIGLEQLNPSGW